MEDKEESKILCRELGRLVGPIAGIGARWAARRLPNVSHEVTFESEADHSGLFESAYEALKEIAKEPPGFLRMETNQGMTAVVGSGIQNLNPTLMTLQLKELGVGASLHIRAVAKEGAIPQNSSKLAVDRLLRAINLKLLNTSEHPRSGNAPI